MTEAHTPNPNVIKAMLLAFIVASMILLLTGCKITTNKRHAMVLTLRSISHITFSDNLVSAHNGLIVVDNNTKHEQR